LRNIQTCTNPFLTWSVRRIFDSRRRIAS